MDKWWDVSWSPITGCTPISDGCQNCWAKRMANRLKGRFGYPEDEPFRVTYHPDKIEQPLKWRKPRRIFVCSMGDLFHSDVCRYQIMNILSMAELCQQHTFIILTKRPERMKAEIIEHFNWMERAGGDGTYFKKLSNLWLGVSVENQKAADERIPILLDIPAAVRFVSAEPLLSSLDLSKWFGDDLEKCVCGWRGKEENMHDDYAGDTFDYVCPRCGSGDVGELSPLDWIVAGGETGAGARKLNPEWVGDIYDQCKNARTPFFFKQWGSWIEKLSPGTKVPFAKRMEIENCKEFPVNV